MMPVPGKKGKVPLQCTSMKWYCREERQGGKAAAALATALSVRKWLTGKEDAVRMKALAAGIC